MANRNDNAGLLALAAALESWAQNEEMVDSGYTEHGLDCLAAAKVLRCAAGEG